MTEILIHSKTKTVFRLAAKNKTKYKTDSGAIFPIHECEEWKENFPMIADAMPPELGQVVVCDRHVFTVVRRAMDRETGQKRLWFCDVTTRQCGFYALDDCSLVSDTLIKDWVDAIALHRHYHKEDTPEYRAFIQEIPAPIRDLCIVRSFNKIFEKLPLGKEGEFF